MKGCLTLIGVVVVILVGLATIGRGNGTPAAPATAEQIEQADLHMESAADYRAEGELGLALAEMKQAVGVAPGYQPAKTMQGEIAKEATATAQPGYEIVYSLSNARFDRGKSLYVLIGPVDLSNGRFKEDIKEITRILVARNGAKTSVEFHDERSSLINSFKHYGDMSLGRNLTRQEDEDRALHLVAAFSGDLHTGRYLNTLEFFTGAFTDHPIVGKYVEAIEFSPR